MIIEFFGLSNTGKSVLKKRLDKEGYSVDKTENASHIVKLFFFLKYLFLHCFGTFYLFYTLNSNHLSMGGLSSFKKLRILMMRNSYLALVLSKYEKLRNKKVEIFVEEFSFQSLFMIFQIKSNKKQLKRAIEKLPKSDFLFLFEGDRKKRYEAYKLPHPYRPGATHLPGSWIDHDYAGKWMKSMEYNFETIKGIILDEHELEDTGFKSITSNYPKVYARRK